MVVGLVVAETTNWLNTGKVSFFCLNGFHIVAGSENIKNIQRIFLEVFTNKTTISLLFFLIIIFFCFFFLYFSFIFSRMHFSVPSGGGGEKYIKSPFLYNNFFFSSSFSLLLLHKTKPYFCQLIIPSVGECFIVCFMLCVCVFFFFF